jgi:hypothetical protein
VTYDAGKARRVLDFSRGRDPLEGIAALARAASLAGSA